MKRTRKIVKLILVFLLSISLVGCKGCNNKKEEISPSPTPTASTSPTPTPSEEVVEKIDEDGIYDTKEEVALYIHTYGKLPSNYMTKSEARKLGWESGALHLVVEDKCIGGDIYSNYEGSLPEINGNYYECDIDTLTKKQRGAKRIVFSDEGDIYYTEDHYDTFEKIEVD